MKSYQASKIHNIALLGHSGSGKTSFTESVLFNAGVIERMGRSADGNTVMNFDPEEQRRHTTLNTSVAACTWGDKKVNLIDTPGDFDFMGEVMQGLRVADHAIITISGKSGVTVGASKSVRFAERQNVPYSFFISKLDDETADFKKVVADIRSRFGRDCMPVMYPLYQNREYKGFVDILKKKAYRNLEDGKMEEMDMPNDLAEDISDFYDDFMEQIAESDDELLEKYFDEEPFTDEEIETALKERIRAGHFMPIYCGSAYNNQGVQFAVDFQTHYMPSAAEHRAMIAIKEDGSTLELQAEKDGPLAAVVFKTIADPFVGRITYLRVFSGKLTAGATVYNMDREKDERLANLSYMVGKQQIATDEVVAGDIASVTKLTATQTGDTFSSKAQPLRLNRIVFPKPAFSMAIKPVTDGEEEKIASGLSKIQEEDQTFSYGTHPETGELVISGLGELQLEVIRSKLKNKYKVESVLKEPRIPFRETVRKTVKVQGRHKKQSGGHGQYGDVWIEFGPGDTEELTFEENVFGGSVPRNFFPAVEKGLRESVQEGVLAGYPVVNLKATLVDGSYHDVDSSELAFKIAAQLAYRNGISQAGPVLMEPISTVEVHVPEDNMGDIMSDVNKRRGRILGMEPKGEMQVIQCEVPTAEMARYATDLRAMTQGAGWYTIEFARYEQMPENLAQRIIEQANAEKE